jgi:ribosomal RNA-processing protein 17
MSKNKSKSNVALLTEGQSYIARAKKERREQVESIKFDDDARRLAVPLLFEIQLISGNG